MSKELIIKTLRLRFPNLKLVNGVGSGLLRFFIRRCLLNLHKLICFYSIAKVVYFLENHQSILQRIINNRKHHCWMQISVIQSCPNRHMGCLGYRVTSACDSLGRAMITYMSSRLSTECEFTEKYLNKIIFKTLV